MLSFVQPINTYAEVAKILRMDAGTVRTICLRFVENNHSVQLARKFNGKTPHKITSEIAQYLKNSSTLEDWAGCSLKERVNLIWSKLI
jgi:hypothetical protein